MHTCALSALLPWDGACSLPWLATALRGVVAGTVVMSRIATHSRGVSGGMPVVLGPLFCVHCGLVGNLSGKSLSKEDSCVIGSYTSTYHSPAERLPCARRCVSQESQWFIGWARHPAKMGAWKRLRNGSNHWSQLRHLHPPRRRAWAGEGQLDSRRIIECFTIADTATRCLVHRRPSRTTTASPVADPPLRHTHHVAHVGGASRRGRNTAGPKPAETSAMWLERPITALGLRGESSSSPSRFLRDAKLCLCAVDCT